MQGDKIKPKQLRKVSTGQIFAFTEALAQRSDMVPVWPDGVDPNEPTRKSGLTIDEGRESALRDHIGDLEAKIEAAAIELLSKDREIADLQEQLKKSNAQVIALGNRAGTEEQEDPPADAENKVTETPVEVQELSRQDKIDLAVGEIYGDSNPDDLTKGGLPRIPAIEARCGFNDVTPEERKRAAEAHKNSKG